MAPAPTETMLIGPALAPLFDPPLVGAVELELGAERTVAEDAPGDVTDTDEAVVDAEVDDGGAVADADADESCARGRRHRRVDGRDGHATHARLWGFVAEEEEDERARSSQNLYVMKI